MLSKVNRLKGKANFEQVFKKGEKFYSPYFVVYKHREQKLPETPPRIGIIASKKVGKAVERNNAKRKISEYLRLNISAIPANTNVVVVALNKLATASNAEVAAAFSSLLSKF